MTVYFTSDLHLGHSAILEMTHRPFEDIDQMNARLIRSINERVSTADTLWILGDISYRLNREDASKLIRKINCRDIRLVKGNHDKEWDGYGLFREICDYKELKLDNRRVILSHYPFAVWNGMHREAVHLHGHMHNKRDYNIYNAMNERRIWDVGVDANGYQPISWEEISEALALDRAHDEAWRKAMWEEWERVKPSESDLPTASHHETSTLIQAL